MRLIRRQETWVLTIQGWLLIFACVIVLMLSLLTHIHSFLAPNYPIPAEILVVEGWIPDHALEQAIREFEEGEYQKLIITGFPLEKGYYLAQYKTSAELAAATLIKLGFAKDKIIAVPTENVIRNRTAATAMALHEWIVDSNLQVSAVNVYTFDVHARRSWLIFKKTLAPKIKVGVIAVSPYSYNPKRWWVYSEGVRTIISETIAYIYARFVNWEM